MNLDQKQPGFPAEVLPRYLAGLGIDYRFVEADTYSIVKEKIPEGKTTCSLCSRLRRGIIYRTAKALGANKIALGHHRDDLVETLLLSALYSGALKSMPPKLLARDGRNVVVRPLCYAAEEDIAAFAAEMGSPRSTSTISPVSGSTMSPTGIIPGSFSWKPFWVRLRTRVL